MKYIWTGVIAMMLGAILMGFLLQNPWVLIGVVKN